MDCLQHGCILPAVFSCPPRKQSSSRTGPEPKRTEEKRGDANFEARLQEHEVFRHAEIGKEQRMQRISAGAGGSVDGAVAVLVRVLGGG